jgi:pimeloyl-ACP methyl ester carboxylesterase
VYQAGLPDAEIVRIADAAHAVWLEHPQHMADIVARFLQ